MTADIWQLGSAALLVVLAGLFSAADAALGGFSRARAEELKAEGRPGAVRLVKLLDDPARYLNTALLMRLLCEISAIVLVATWARDAYQGSPVPTFLTTIGVMLVVSFVVIGVAPRTIGRQHDVRVALASAGPLSLVTTILGPIPALLILLGNAITPGKGFSEGPFSTETELRELVDMAEAGAIIESGERKMIHSVFELGDTITREVMVPRPDVVYIERHKNIRQTLSLFLRSGYSRIPVIDENLDDIVGMAYLKDLVRRDFEAPDVEFTQRVDEVMRPVHYVPDSKPVDALLTELQARRQHIAVVVDEYDAEEVEVEHLEGGAMRVSSRYPVDDLDELVGFDVEDDDVDSVGGLMAKHLGKVPLPGSVVECHGLRLEAERATGRRNKIETVLVTVLAPESDDTADDTSVTSAGR